MGMWDEFCLICGVPTFVSFTDMADESGNPLPNPPNAEDYKWVEDVVGVTTKEELIKLGEDDGYGGFHVPPNPEGYTSFSVGLELEYSNGETDGHGYACHVKCHNLLQKELGYTLRYQDVRPLLVDSNYCALNIFKWSDYGGLSDYHDQSFGEQQLFEDGKMWMIEDPTGNEANAQRIVALWRPLLQTGFAVPEGLRGAAETPAVAADAPSSVRTDSDDVVCTPNSTTFAEVLRLD